MNPISATLLVRDDRHVLQTIAQLRPHVAEIVVGYTHNDSLTAAELEAAGARIVVVPGPLRDWSTARNAVHSAATQPYVLWADSDDEFRGLERLPEALRMLDGHPLARLLCPYEYSRDELLGGAGHVQYRERIVRNDGRFHWTRPCHETLVAKDGRYGDGPEPQCDFLVWEHHREEQPESLGQQLEMLRAYEADGHQHDPWLLLNMGNTLRLLRRPAEALPYLARSVELSGWTDERALTMVEMHHCMLQVVGIGGDDSDAMMILTGARDLAPHLFEPHFAMGKLWTMRGVLGGELDCFRRALECFAAARACPPPTHPLGRVPWDRAYYVHDCERMCHETLGDFAGARDATARMQEARPGDGGVRLLRAKYEAAIKLEAAEAESEWPAPAPLSDDEAADVMRELGGQTARAIEADFAPHLRAYGKLDVIFACGPSFTEWSPAVLAEKGLGGSETAVIEMARRLAAKGHRVRVFCRAGGAGIYDGVEYRDWNAVTERPQCDVLIAWRDARQLLFADARARLLWVHDVEAMNLSPYWAVRADRVLALSEWHRGNLIAKHKLPESQVWRTRNGVDATRFQMRGDYFLDARTGDPVPMPKRNAHRAIYSSSGDRGLQVLLDLWPAIRSRVPDAEIVVAYGLDIWKAVAEQSGSQQQRYAVLSLERRLKATEGVRYIGAVDQRTLAREMLGAGAMLYPGWFDETSCIGAMEAQAAGLRIVASNRAALSETVGTRGVLLDGDWLSDAYQRRFVDEAVEALTALDPWRGWTREGLQKYARESFSWDGVCDEWEMMLGAVLRDCEAGVMPEFRRVA